MSMSTIMPVWLYALKPRGTVSAIYCRANLPACYPAAPRGFRVIDVDVAKDHVELLNLATGTNATVTRSEIFNIRVFVTWETVK